MSDWRHGCGCHREENHEFHDDAFGFSEEAFGFDFGKHEGLEGVHGIAEGLHDISEGILENREGLCKIKHCHIREGAEECREGAHHCEEGLCDIVEELREACFRNGFLNIKRIEKGLREVHIGDKLVLEGAAHVLCGQLHRGEREIAEGILLEEKGLHDIREGLKGPFDGFCKRHRRHCDEDRFEL